MSGTTTQFATGEAYSVSLSANGAKLVFISRSPTDKDYRGIFDNVWVEDVATGAFTLVSAGASGPANYTCNYVSISADGTKVAFQTAATNLVPGVADSQYHTYVKDLATGALTLVDTGSYGVANNSSSWSAISGDGTKVAFTSDATNLVLGDTNMASDVFVKDLVTGAVTLVTTGTNGQANQRSYLPSLSADGSEVGFLSYATNLAPGAASGNVEPYVKNLGTGMVTLVGADLPGSFDVQTTPLSFSANGTKVAFTRGYGWGQLTGGYVPELFGVYVEDLTTGISTLASGGQGFAPSLSADGTKLAFLSYDALTPDDTNNGLDIYVKDLSTGALTRAATGSAGLQYAPIFRWNSQPSISADGSKLAFQGYQDITYRYFFGYLDSFAPPNRAPTALALSGTSVAEHVPAGTVVGTLSDTDPDAGDTASFSLVPGAGSADDAAFTINGNQLALAVTPDYDTQQSYSIRVRATDSGGLYYEQAFTVGVINVNDPPAISGGGAATVPDNAAASPFSNPASSIVVSDPDLGQTETATVTYAAANGTLYDPNAAADGSASAAGTYTVSGTTAQVTAALRGLVFAPTANQVPVGRSVSTTFALLVSDGSLTAADSSTVLVAASVNDAPLALVRAGSVDEDGGPLLLSPGWADPDPGDSHGFALNLAGTKGAATIDPVTGAISYSPNGAFEWLSTGQTATDTFTYAVTDGSGASATANVTVTVLGANDAPVIVAGSTSAAGATTERAGATGLAAPDAASGSIAFTDVDLLDQHTVGSSLTGVTWSGPGAAASGGGGAVPDALRSALAQALAATLGGDSTGGATGMAKWSFALPDSSFDFLAQGDVLTATYAFTVADAHGGTAVQPVTVTVTGTNDAAVVGGTATGAVKEDTTLSASGQLTVADPDAGQSAFQVPASLAGKYGAFALDAGTGKWSYALANGSAAVQALAAGQAVTDALTVTSLDGTASQAITVSVAGTNDAPAIDPAVTTAAGGVTVSLSSTAGALTAAGTIGFTDPDLADAHSAAAAFVGSTYAGGQLGALQAVVSADTTGTGAGGRVGWTYAVDDSRVRFLGTGQQVTETYNVTVSDGQGGTAAQAVAVTITGTNHPPTITGAVASQAVGDNATVKPFAAVQVADPDPGARDSLAITLTGGDANGLLSGASLTKTGAGAYQLAAAAPGALTAALDALVFTPTANQVAVGKTVTTGFTLKATDDQGATATNAVASVAATSVNDAPTLAKPTLSYAVAEGQTVQNLYRDILANARDADPGDAAQLTIASIGLPAAGGTAYLDPARKVLTYTAGGFNAKQASDGFTYMVADGHGGTVTGTVALTVTGAALPTQVGTAGPDVLTANSAGTRLVGGGGNDVFALNAAGALAFGGSGDDLFTVNAAKAAVHGGAGTNTVVLGAAQDSVVLQQGGRDEIYGFNLRNGSQLDLSQVLAEAQLALTGPAQLGAYFGVTSSGADAALSFNANGTASGPGSVLAVLHGVGTGVSLGTLIGYDLLKVS